MKAIVIYGPTSSGKSLLAHQLAQQIDGEIINIDSSQIFKDLHTITASPDNKLKKEIPYHLYNFLDISENISPHKYCLLAAEKIQQINQKHKIPILVGGTGLYIKSLLNGIHDIPEITRTEYNEIKNKRDQIGVEKFFRNLCELDPLSSALKEHDTHRVIRSYHILHRTGKSIFQIFQENKRLFIPQFNCYKIFLSPEKDYLYDKVIHRMTNILNSHEAIKEVQNLINIYSYEKVQNVKIIPVHNIVQFLEQKINFNQLIQTSTSQVRKYAKRQYTWFNHQINSNKILTYSNSQEFVEKLPKYINYIIDNMNYITYQYCDN